MTILLAPAESKNEGGEEKSFNKDNFFLKENFEKREFVFNEYEKYLDKSTLEELSIWFGIKKISIVEKYKESLKNKKTMKAIKRYSGVAFDALNYTTLNKIEQNYIDNSVVIFSNLFGPIKANDLIPDYKFKQGAKLENLKIEQYYLDNFSNSLDEYLDEEVLDLRAGHYEKFYKLKNKKVLTFKFLKDGKVVSHWAKHYRGYVLREIAINNVSSFAQLKQIEFKNLELVEIQQIKNIETMIVNIK